MHGDIYLSILASQWDEGYESLLDLRPWIFN